ncbi:hypothetical protein Ae201684_009734 [Aphanomyces euteiches]|uniref:Cytochrome P450 n=1 Tax=Aphanomyces euteiches TaxID=100861 RepID=A0A6G0X138_9STRA|nr:hypothetical protein Ae201684_009734 [Aphanomyces euteiches]
MIINIVSLVSLEVATATSTILLGALALHCLWKSRQYCHLPQPPPSSFVFGHLFDTWARLAHWGTRGDYPQPFLSWTEQYGGVIYLRQFLEHAVLVTDPVALQHILVANGTNYPRQPIAMDYTRDVVLGESLISVDGKKHDVYRKYLNPMFAVSKLKTFVKIFNEQTQLVCQTVLDPACDTNAPVNLSNMLTKMMLSITGLTVLGYDFNKSPTALEAYEQSMLPITPLVLVGTFTIPGFLSFPIPSLVKRRNAQAALKKILMLVIHDKLAAPNSDQPKDLLDMILPHASTDEAIPHTLTFMTAGHDTTSSTLAFVFSTLASYPQVVAAIRAEYEKITAVYGSLGSWEALAELEYTHAVIQETLRLNAVAFSTVQRVSLANDNVAMSNGSSVFIPKVRPQQPGRLKHSLVGHNSGHQHCRNASQLQVLDESNRFHSRTLRGWHTRMER